MEKSPSEVGKWLSGTHNFTIKTMAKIEHTLGEELILIKKEYKYERFAEITEEEEAVYAYKKQKTEELLKLQAEAFHNLQVKNL
jgi:predicted metal-binding protein